MTTGIPFNFNRTDAYSHLSLKYWNTEGFHYTDRKFATILSHITCIMIYPNNERIVQIMLCNLLSYSKYEILRTQWAVAILSK